MQTSYLRRHAPFFQALQAELTRLNRQDDSRVCVLTPGPMNETYFEHAFLARYLGFLLVEGEDLTVRDNGVFIRTVSGLKRTEVLLRRLDDKTLTITLVQRIDDTHVRVWPSGTVPVRDQMRLLEEAGFAEVESLGMKYVSIPWSGSSYPSSSQVVQFLDLVRANPQAKIFVHCKRGADRTGVMVAAYRIAFEHKDVADAVLE